MNMKRVFVLFALCLGSFMGYAQEYTVTSAGQGHSGNYLVNVVVSTKGKNSTKAEDLVMHYAVHGVLFRGLMAGGEISSCGITD